MRKILLLSILLITISFTANAQDKTTNIKKLFELMQTDKMMDEMMQNMMPMFTKAASEKIKGDTEREKFNQFTVSFSQEMKELSKKILNEEMPKIYEKYFDEKDIKYLIKFYKSPTGIKLLEKTPEITKELMGTMFNKYIPEIANKVKLKFEDLKKIEQE